MPLRWLTKLCDTFRRAVLQPYYLQVGYSPCSIIELLLIGVLWNLGTMQIVEILSLYYSFICSSGAPAQSLVDYGEVLAWADREKLRNLKTHSNWQLKLKIMIQ